jgi:hypothetical protein
MSVQKVNRLGYVQSLYLCAWIITGIYRHNNTFLYIICYIYTCTFLIPHFLSPLLPTSSDHHNYFVHVSIYSCFVHGVYKKVVIIFNYTRFERNIC